MRDLIRPRLLAAPALLTLGLMLLASTVAAREEGEAARLAALLTDDNPVVRKRAAIALGELGEGARSAVPALEKALTDSEPGVRVAVAEALDKITGGSGTGSGKLEDLIQLVTDGKADAGKRKAALKQLVEAHYKEDAAVKAISQALLDPVLKNDAARALDEIDRKRAGVAPVPLKELVLKGHTDDCFGVGFTPDGLTLLTSSRDGTLRTWDAATGKELKVFHTNEPTFGLSVHPDGKRVAAACDTATRIYAIAGGDKALKEVKLHSVNYIGSVAYSPDGKRVASCGEDKMVRIWDPETGKELVACTGHDGVVYSVAWTPDGKLLVSGSQDGKAIVWDTATGNPVYTFKNHMGGVYGVAVSPDGKRVATGGIGDQTVRIWDIRTGNNELVLKGHAGNVRGVAFSPDGKLLASAGEDQVVKLWDPKTGKDLHTFKGHTGNCIRVAFSPEGKRLLSSSWDHDVRLWVVPDLKP